MAKAARVILSALADESAFHLTAVEQFSALAALGLEYYSLRFIDAGKGVKNVMQLTLPEIRRIRHLEDEYGLNVTSIASPIGKVKLRDVDDGTKNRFVPFAKYLAKDVARACELAHAFETKLIRGFSFYHPRGDRPEAHLEEAADRIGKIAEACHRSDLTFGLEVEANLVGQGMTAAEVYRQWEAMKPGLGWVHVKDYRKPTAKARDGHVDEGALAHFVPADRGAGGHERILADLKSMLPALTRRLEHRGIPGVFLDLEPHVRGGGQFGGTSGPDGMGIALRGLCRVLDGAGIDYHLRDFDDLLAARGRK